MTVEDGLWDVRLSAAANADFRNIFDWTHEQFGAKQALIYADMMIVALETLADGPTTIGVKERTEIAKGLFTLPIGRGAPRGRHFVLFRVARKRSARTIEVLRLLHNAMDLERHIPGGD